MNLSACLSKLHSTCAEKHLGWTICRNKIIENVSAGVVKTAFYMSRGTLERINLSEGFTIDAARFGEYRRQKSTYCGNDFPVVIYSDGK